MQWIGSIVTDGRGIIVGSAVLFMVETDMNGATQLRKIPVQISEKEFDVATEDLMVFLRKVPLGLVRLQVFGAEHPDRPLKLGTAQGKIESDREHKPRFPQNELHHENGEGCEGEGDHDS
jgi:hypothetical protein